MALPTTKCPDCEKIITVKGLKRHQKDKHSNLPKKYKCIVCGYATNREIQLMDHNRRKHTDPVKMGRPKKKGKERETKTISPELHGNCDEV